MEHPLLAPERLYTPAELATRPSPVPRAPGLYAWYVRDVPPMVPTDGCRWQQGRCLLYVGISPRRPRADGRASAGNLRSRLRQHLRGNASSSTLRLTLGCLLAEPLGLELRRTGASGRLTFGPGERDLSGWMDDNAAVVWHETPEPWLDESSLLQEVPLPLNLDQNDSSPFAAELAARRRRHRAAGRLRSW